MSLFGAAHGLGGQKGPRTSTMSHICNSDKTWQSHILPKENPKNI